jgi:hypothetical protein
MSTRRIGLAVVALLALGGCATTADYPRCYLFRAPDDTDIARVDHETSQVITRAFRPRAYAATRDAVVIEAAPSMQGKIRRAWPAFGCVNLRRPPPWSADIVDKWVVQRCQDYLAKLLQRVDDEDSATRADVASQYYDITCH